MSNILKIVLVALIFSGCFSAINFVSAAPGDFGMGNITKVATGTKFYKEKSDLGSTIGAVISGILALAGTIFLILTVYGGITWMTAMGNSDKVEKAKSIIIAAVIGGAITAAAYVITYFIMARLIVTSNNNDKTFGNCTFKASDTNQTETDSMTQSECSAVNGQWVAK